MKNKMKTILVYLAVILLCLSGWVYAGYIISANDVTYTKADGTTVSVKEALDELNEQIPEGSSSTVAASTATTHTAKAITYSWDELSNIAKSISDNASITNNTAEVKVKLNGAENTLGVGDTITLDSKKVRILGFNHDKLASSTAYGAATATGKAGISFEYVDFLTTAQMNSSNTNSGGWKDCALRSTLNGTTYSNLSIKDKIKQVTKDYIPTYNNSSTSTCNDYLWLLSCAEIWDNGYKSTGKGYAMGVEGSQYKYYKSTLGSTAYNSSTDITKKPNVSNSTYWWLRSPRYNNSSYFCGVGSDGNCNYHDASYSYGVAPGFSI